VFYGYSGCIVPDLATATARTFSQQQWEALRSSRPDSFTFEPIPIGTSLAPSINDTLRTECTCVYQYGVRHALKKEKTTNVRK
jgi:hypothetical protein